MYVLTPHPKSLIIHKCVPHLQLSVVNAPPTLLDLSIQGRCELPPPPSAMRAYTPLLSDLLPYKFETPLQPSNVPAPITQISALHIQSLVLNPPPPLSVSFQGQGEHLILPSVAHDNATLLPVLSLCKVVPPLLP